MPMNSSLFVSYARKDIKKVDFIINALVERGIKPWIDRTHIPPAAPWREACLDGVERCHSLLFLLSPTSAISPACAMEIEHALECNRRIIPMLIQPVGRSVLIHPELSRLNWLRFDLDEQKAIGQLFELLDSPIGSMIYLVNRPSAVLDILYPDGEQIQRPLFQDCYWGGRNPIPPAYAAGKIHLKNTNPDRPLISVLHFVLAVVEDKWVVMDASKNGGFIFSRNSRQKLPPYPPGWVLSNGDRIEIFGNTLTYREIQPKTNSDLINGSEFLTFPGFE